MKPWSFILSKLTNGQKVVLLYVLDNKGSSPGRKHFSMAISEDGQFEGTIGGGIMEVKLLELARNKLSRGDRKTIIKKQYHDKVHTSDRSGLICSGEQTVTIVPLEKTDIKTVQEIVSYNGKDLMLCIDNKGLSIVHGVKKEDFSTIENKESFSATFRVKQMNRIHIFGGGHVGLAVSQVMSQLDYYVKVYEDRPELNTLEQNEYANTIKIIDYSKIMEECSFEIEDSVVLVTTSFKTDKALLKQLYQEPFAYIGMMGSKNKIKTLFEELVNEGIRKEELDHVFAPIGMDIYSKTTMEIAISIAGQIILEKNKNLPTGRK